MASKSRSALKEINGNSSPIRPLRTTGKGPVADRRYTHEDNVHAHHHKHECSHRHKKRRSSYVQSNPLVESFTVACENYLESAAVRVEANIDDVYRQLLTDLDQDDDDRMMSDIAEMRASLQSLSQPLESDSQHGSALASALRYAQKVEDKVRVELETLTEQHRALTDRINKTYDDLVDSVSPVKAVQGKRQREQSLAAEHEHHFADLEKQIQEIDRDASNAIDNQIRKEGQDRRKIESMLERLWDE